MTTTYYFLLEEPCETCGHLKDEAKIEIGWQAVGWKFVFLCHKDKNITNFIEFLSFCVMNKPKIVDEYERFFTVREFLNNIVLFQDFRTASDRTTKVEFKVHVDEGFSYQDHFGITFTSR